MAYLILAIHFDIDATDAEAIRDIIEQLQQAELDHIKRVDLLNENDYIDNTVKIGEG